MSGLDGSRSWWERAQRVIPLGTQTLSKSPTQFVQGVSPHLPGPRRRGPRVRHVLACMA